MDGESRALSEQGTGAQCGWLLGVLCAVLPTALTGGDELACPQDDPEEAKAKFYKHVTDRNDARKHV